MLENDQEIILDSTNNVFVGPDKYFKIVIDEFDGTTVKAWHVEDAKGNKTGNLAERSKGKHIDVLINNSNRSVSHFSGRISGQLLSEQEAKIKELQAKVQNAPKEVKESKPVTESNGVPVSVPILIALVALVVIIYQAKTKKAQS